MPRFPRTQLLAVTALATALAACGGPNASPRTVSSQTTSPTCSQYTLFSVADQQGIDMLIPSENADSALTSVSPTSIPPQIGRAAAVALVQKLARPRGKLIATFHTVWNVSGGPMYVSDRTHSWIFAPGDPIWIVEYLTPVHGPRCVLPNTSKATAETPVDAVTVWRDPGSMKMPPLLRVVMNRGLAQRLYERLWALPPQRPPEPLRFCPIDFGVEWQIDFQDRGSIALHVTVEAQGCDLLVLSNGTWAEADGPTGNAFWAALGTVAGIPAWQVRPALCVPGLTTDCYTQ